jgi:hypothetical protein
MTSQFIINEPPLQVIPTLARDIGLNEAIILQQVHYWLNLQFSRCLIEEQYWVRYSLKQWGCQFPFWDKKTLRRAINNLEKLEVLVSLVREDSSKAKYYAINYWRLDQLTSPTKSQHASFSSNSDDSKGGN